jgi:hypothetical protein
MSRCKQQGRSTPGGGGATKKISHTGIRTASQRRGQTGPKRAQKQKHSLAPGCCALAAAAPGEGALQKRRLACWALAATVRYSRGTAARRRALQPERRSTAQSQHGAVRCSQGVTARHRALQPGRHSTARRRALQPGHHSTAPCAATPCPWPQRNSAPGALSEPTQPPT